MCYTLKQCGYKLLMDVMHWYYIHGWAYTAKVKNGPDPLSKFHLRTVPLWQSFKKQKALCKALFIHQPASICPWLKIESVNQSLIHQQIFIDLVQ